MVPIHRSMVRFKVAVVCYGEGPVLQNWNIPQVFTDFLRQLREEKFKQAKEKHLTWRVCNEDTLKDSRLLVPNIYDIPLVQAALLSLR
jgi:hypothetical protein